MMRRIRVAAIAVSLGSVGLLGWSLIAFSRVPGDPAASELGPRGTLAPVDKMEEARASVCASGCDLKWVMMTLR